VQLRHLLLCASLLAAAPVFANDGPPSEASIQQLLTLTNARQLLDQMKGQLDSFMNAASREALKDQTLTPERQAVLDRMRTKMTAVVSEMLNWDTLEPMYVRIYRASLTQDELNGIIAFYSSDAGQAFVHKMPAIMQSVMAETQGMMKPMQQKLAEIEQQAMQELKAIKSAQGAAASQGVSTS
jgi:uncharacterized protein